MCTKNPLKYTRFTCLSFSDSSIDINTLYIDSLDRVMTNLFNIGKPSHKKPAYAFTGFANIIT